MQNMYISASKFLKQVGYTLRLCHVSQKLGSIFSKRKHSITHENFSQYPLLFQLKFPWTNANILFSGLKAIASCMLTDSDEGMCCITAMDQPFSSQPCPNNPPLQQGLVLGYSVD